jgi:DUF1680 family protein
LEFPEEQGTTLVVSAAKPAEVDLRLRIPYLSEKRKREGEWTSAASFLPRRQLPCSRRAVEERSLPTQLRPASTPDRDGFQAAMYGPLVLAARFEDEPKEKWCRHYQAQTEPKQTPPLRMKGKLDDPAS